MWLHCFINPNNIFMVKFQFGEFFKYASRGRSQCIFHKNNKSNCEKQQDFQSL